MRRVFPLLLLTPFLVNCSDATTPVASPPSAMHSVEDVPAEGEWPVEANWFTPGGVLEIADDELTVQTASADASTSANAPKQATMVFGNPDAGTEFPGPPGTHDQSFHAKDRINPGSVSINAGETVRFQIYIGHRVAIYDEGMMPSDIQPTPGPLLLYPVNRLFLQPSPTPQFTLRFMRPGKYLVICAINSHFFGANMWGWIHVK